MYFTVKKKTIPKERGWFTKALRRVANRTPVIQQVRLESVVSCRKTACRAYADLRNVSHFSADFAVDGTFWFPMYVLSAQFCSSTTEVRHVTVDKDGRVHDQFGRPVKCYDKEVSVGEGYVMIVPNNKYMRCLYFHSESSKSRKKDIRYHGPPPLVGAPPVVFEERLRPTLASISSTRQEHSPPQQHLPSEQLPCPKKDESDSISRQTTASTAC